jgi:hypothetical protein
MHRPAAILDVGDAMSIKPAGAEGKDDVADSNSANWFTPDQEYIAGENRWEHTSAACAEPQLPETAQNFRRKLQPQAFLGSRRGFYHWICKTQEFFLLKLHDACVGDIFPQASAIVSKTRSCWNVGF